MMSREQQLGARGTTLKAGHVSPCARSQSAIDQIRRRIPALDTSQAPPLASALWSWIRYLTLNHFSHRWKIVRRVEGVHVIAISKPWISREMVGNCVCGLLLSRAARAGLTLPLAAGPLRWGPLRGRSKLGKHHWRGTLNWGWLLAYGHIGEPLWWGWGAGHEAKSLLHDQLSSGHLDKVPLP